MRQGLVLGGVGVLVFAAVAIATLPASLLLAHLPPELAAEGASGTVWSGAAETLTLRGVALGQLRWDAEPAALLHGRLAYRIELTRPDGQLRGRFAAGLGATLRAEGVELRLPLTTLTPGFAGNGWRGEVAGTIDSARLERGWPVELSAHLTLSRLQPPGASREIGSYALDFDPGASTPAQLRGRVRDLEAPLTVRAQLLIRRDRSYTLDGEVTPRAGTPPEVSTAIAFLGSPDAAGRRTFAFGGSF